MNDTIGGIDAVQIILCDDNGDPIGKEYTFVLSDGLKMRAGMPEEKDAPDQPMEDGSWVQFIRGKRFYAELKFVASNETLQIFLVDLANHNSKIKFIPHVDKPQWYWVVKKSGFDFPYFEDKFPLGFQCDFRFEQDGFSPSVDWT